MSLTQSRNDHCDTLYLWLWNRIFNIRFLNVESWKISFCFYQHLIYIKVEVHWNKSFSLCGEMIKNIFVFMLKTCVAFVFLNSLLSCHLKGWSVNLLLNVEFLHCNWLCEHEPINFFFLNFTLLEATTFFCR